MNETEYRDLCAAEALPIILARSFEVADRRRAENGMPPVTDINIYPIEVVDAAFNIGTAMAKCRTKLTDRQTQ